MSSVHGTLAVLCAAFLELHNSFEPDKRNKTVKQKLVDLIHEITKPESLILDDCQETYENEGKIPAIRKYRNETSSSLKDAKDAIENAARERGWLERFKFEVGNKARHITLGHVEITDRSRHLNSKTYRVVYSNNIENAPEACYRWVYEDELRYS